MRGLACQRRGSGEVGGDRLGRSAKGRSTRIFTDEAVWMVCLGVRSTWSLCQGQHTGGLARQGR